MLELHLIINNEQEEEMDVLEGVMESVQDWLAKMHEDKDVPDGCEQRSEPCPEQPKEASMDVQSEDSGWRVEYSEAEQPIPPSMDEPQGTCYPSIDDAEKGIETEGTGETNVQHLTEQQERELIDFLQYDGINVVAETEKTITLDRHNPYVTAHIHQIAPQVGIRYENGNTIVSLPVA